jgi:hypothetical protein
VLQFGSVDVGVVVCLGDEGGRGVGGNGPSARGEGEEGFVGGGGGGRRADGRERLFWEAAVG